MTKISPLTLKLCSKSMFKKNILSGTCYIKNSKSGETTGHILDSYKLKEQTFTKRITPIKSLLDCKTHCARRWRCPNLCHNSATQLVSVPSTMHRAQPVPHSRKRGSNRPFFLFISTSSESCKNHPRSGHERSEGE